MLATDDGTPLIVAGRYGRGSDHRVQRSATTVVQRAVSRNSVVGRLVALAAGGTYEPKTGWSCQAPYYGSMALGAIHEAHDSGRVEISSRSQWDDLASLWADFSDDGAANRIRRRDSERARPHLERRIVATVPVAFRGGAACHICAGMALPKPDP